MVRWSYGWFDADIFAPRVCEELGPYCPHLRANFAVALALGSLVAPGAPVPGNPSQPKRPSRLRESVIYSADEPDLDLGPKYLEPVRDHDTPSDSSSDMLSSPAITITRASSSSHGHDPLTSSTPLHGTLGHQSRSDTSHGWRSRPSSHASNPGRPSSAAVFAALDDLQEVLAAPQLTPEVIQSLQNRIAVFHLLARPAEQASPFSDGSPSTPTRPALAGAPKFLDPMPRRSLPVRGRHGRV
ncbi:hypothetical protein CspeluHIS016_0702360 [Cutaneotrichosporon spelunceum]|uniref:Uncharacterized protein n=1 Tax=Cutaneotrichosporon spelunceum TaxID=1672016 RepID=A0AAD3TZ52_9TREE|nr:hypothetical protein CspeluHIS016_0702360 [Cutaneotrichosporon spelunceum]